MSNTSVAFPAVLVLPITLLAGPLTAYNTAMTLALSGLAAYVLLRRLTGWWGAALARGLVYELSGYVAAQGDDHLNLVFVALPPLIGLVVVELIDPRTSWRPEILGLLLAGLAVAQFFTSSEILATSAIVVIATLAVTGIANLGAARRDGRVVLRPSAAWRPAARRLGRAGVVTAGVGAAVLAYPVWFTLAGSQHVQGLAVRSPTFRADLAGLVVPSRLQAIAPGWATGISDHFVGGNIYENGAYLGLPLLIACLAGAIWFWKQPAVRVAAAMMVFCLVLSLGSSLTVTGTTEQRGYGPGLWLPERLLNYLPLGSDVLAIRFTLYTSLFAAALLALVIDRLHRRPADLPTRSFPTRRLRDLAVGGLVAACLVPLVPAWPYGAEPVPVPAFFTSSAAGSIPPGSTVLLYPFPALDVDGGAPMVWQSVTFMRFRMVGGYFIVPSGPGTSPFFSRVTTTYLTLSHFYSNPTTTVSQQARSAMYDELSSWNVKTVIADPTGPGGARGVAFLSGLIGRPPVAVAGADVWYSVSWP